MKIRLTARNVALTDRLRVHVRRRLALALGRFGERIDKVSVRFTGTGTDALALPGRPRSTAGSRWPCVLGAVSVEDADADPFAAADGATDRLSRSVARALDRERTRARILARRRRIQAMTVAFAERLNVVDELMGTLELVTRAGQQHVMSRILSILRGELLSLGFPLADGRSRLALGCHGGARARGRPDRPHGRRLQPSRPRHHRAFWANLIRRFFRCYLLKLRSGLLLLPGPSMKVRWTPNRD